MLVCDFCQVIGGGKCDSADALRQIKLSSNTHVRQSGRKEKDHFDSDEVNYVPINSSILEA